MKKIKFDIEISSAHFKTAMNQIYILFLISVLTLSCGVKGAPLPKQESSYIFNPEPEASLKEEDLKEKGLDPEKEDSEKNENKENES